MPISKGVLVGYYIIPFKYHLVNLFISICFYSQILFKCKPASVCVRWNTDIQTLFFVRPFLFGSTIHNNFQPAVNNFSSLLGPVSYAINNIALVQDLYLIIF